VLGKSVPASGLGSAGNRTTAQKEKAAEQAKELIEGFAPCDTVCFTDGACINNPGPCGSGAYVKFPDGEAKRSVALGHGSNNIGELYAVGLAMDLIMEARGKGRLLPPEAKIHVLTDSRYAKGMLVLNYKAKSNQELIAAVKGKLAEVCEHNPVFVHWVAGHSQ
jgi:ribonuclease HI